MDYRDSIVALVGSKGPIIPVELKKNLNLDSTFLGAYLSELVASKKVLLSHAKIGGSPVYYVPGQEPKLVRLYDYMNDKEQQAFDLLKNQKIMYDREQEPVIRVALRAIKDFAIPLNVTIDDEIKLFWKWFMISDEEAEIIIKDYLGLNKEKIEEKIEVEEKPIEKTPIQKIGIEEEKKIEKSKPDEKSKLIEKPKKEELISEHVKKNKEKVEEEIIDLSHTLIKDTVKKVDEKQNSMPEYVDSNALEEKEEEMASIVGVSDKLIIKAKDFFEKKGVLIRGHEILKKNKEVNLLVDIPTIMGTVSYFAKVVDKKRTSDKDLSSAFVEGQIKKYPVLYLTTGDYTKKAREQKEKLFMNMLLHNF